MPSSSPRSTTTTTTEGSFQPTSANFYCHTCGRHTSHTARPTTIDNTSSPSSKSKPKPRSKTKSNAQPSAIEASSTTSPSQGTNVPKYCSQRCRAEPRPSPIIGLVWRHMLGSSTDDPTRDPDSDSSAGPVGPTRGSGKDGKVLLCSDVQARVFDPTTGRARWEDGLGGVFEGRTTRFVKDEGGGEGEGEDGRGEESQGGEVEEERRDPATTLLSSSPTTSSRSPPSAQALGMINASNRELVRRSARLLVHFGFDHLTRGKRGRTFPREWEEEAVRVIKEDDRGGIKEVVPVGWDGKVIEDVTHQKGEWGLKWKDQKSRYTS